MKPLRLTLAVLILVAPLSAQQESGVSLTIRFANATSRFHVGEVIPIELSFKASSPDMYDMEMRNYDPGGRLNIEQFHVTPPGRDALAKVLFDWRIYRGRPRWPVGGCPVRHRSVRPRCGAGRPRPDDVTPGLCLRVRPAARPSSCDRYRAAARPAAETSARGWRRQPAPQARARRCRTASALSRSTRPSEAVRA